MRYRLAVGDRDLALLLLIVATAAAADESRDRASGMLKRVATKATGAVVDIVDLEAILERIDINAILEQVDIDALIARIDVEGIVDRVDVKELVERAGIPDIVRESTGALAGSALDVARRQIVALDSIVGRAIYRLVRRDPAERPQAPQQLESGATVERGRGQVTGFYAGPVSRLLAFAADALVIWLLFALIALAATFLIELFLPVDLTGSVRQSFVGLGALLLWGFLYFGVSLSLAGRTFGMGLLGLRVVTRDGAVLTGRQAFVRTIVFPFSFLIFGLGFLGILISPERRALHDGAAGSVVVYDWGDRPAEMPAPITSWLTRHADAEQPLETPADPDPSVLA
jgi:uncharacterized RDD family membrane protein YckC